ncbi:MAG: hypothetical protein KFH98_08255 [Gemmatimonadetes bacterium]|nr:hypothetical protein [Gemmatimonadota bacterium]
MLARDLRAYAHAMIHSAAAWDLMGTAGLLPPWWPPVSYVLAAAGIAAACLAVLAAMLLQRWPRATDAAPAGSPARDWTRTAGQLVAVGILLTGWILRGDPEIPPDMPLVAASVTGAALYAAFTFRRG